MIVSSDISKVDVHFRDEYLVADMRFSLLRFLLHPFLVAFGMSSSVEPREFDNIEFPPDFQDVGSWRNNISSLYRRVPTFREGMNNLTVLEVKHFKSKRHPQHEYLVAAVMDGSQMRFVRIERSKLKDGSAGRQSPDILDSETETEELNRLQTLFSSSSNSLDFLYYRAHDRVRTLHKWGMDECLQTAKFLPCTMKPRLFDLALISSLVSDSSPLYKLFKSQCYWFANVILHVLLESYPNATLTIHSKETRPNYGKDEEDEVLAPQDTDPQDLRRRALEGDIGQDWITGMGSKAGKWFSVPIYRTRKKLVSKIATRFHDTQAKEMSRVRFPYYSNCCWYHLTWSLMSRYQPSKGRKTNARNRLGGSKSDWKRRKLP